MTVEERLEKVERELANVKPERWLLPIVALTLGGLAVVWTSTRATFAAQARAVHAHKFVLEDEKGQVRAELGMTEDAPWLFLSDEKGKRRALLSLTEDGLPGLFLCDEKGQSRVGLNLDKSGAMLSINGEKGKIRVWLRVTKGGEMLGMKDEKGQVRAALGVDKLGAGFMQLFGPDGEAIWSAPLAAPTTQPTGQ